MARIRTIKPSFFTSLTIAGLTYRQRLLFIGLWTHVDDEGRCVYDPRLLKAAIWPLDEVTPEEIRSDTGALQEASILTVYRVGERSYIHLGTFLEHQKISHPTKSTLPSPEEGEIYAPTSTLEDSVSTHGGFTEDSVNAPGRKGKERKGREAENDPPREDVELICTRTADLVEANGSKRPTITDEWRTQARLLLDRDRRQLDLVLAVLEWSQASSFWRSNVQGVPKLREKFDVLRLQRDDELAKIRPPTQLRGYGLPGERRSLV